MHIMCSTPFFIIVFFLFRHFIFVIWDIPVIDLDFFFWKFSMKTSKAIINPILYEIIRLWYCLGSLLRANSVLCAIVGVEIDEPNNSIIKKNTVSFLSAPFPILHIGIWKVNNLQVIMQNFLILFGAFFLVGWVFWVSLEFFVCTVLKIYHNSAIYFKI